MAASASKENHVLLWIFAAIVTFGAMYTLWRIPGSTPRSSARTKAVTFSSGSFCAPQLSDAALAVTAAQTSDLAAYSSLISGGKAFMMQPGDRAEWITVERTLASVRLTSGDHLGETCWTLGKSILPNNHTYTPPQDNGK